MPQKALSKLKEALDRVSDDEFFKSLIDHLMAGELIEPISLQKISPSHGDNSIFILSTIMICHEDDYHGPYDIQSIQNMIDHSVAKNCPECRRPIENIISFEDYLSKIKEAINVSQELDNDINDQIITSLNQLIGLCDLKNDDIDAINAELSTELPPVLPPVLPPELPPVFLNVNPSEVEALLLTVTAAALLYDDNDGLLENGVAASMVILASLLRLGGRFIVRSENSDRLIRSTLPECMLLCSAVAWTGMQLPNSDPPHVLTRIFPYLFIRLGVLSCLWCCDID